MFDFHAEGAGKVYMLRCEGTLTDADYKELEPKLDAAIARHGTIRMLADITGWDGMEVKAVWDDFVLGIRHWNDFERIAVVGDEGWQDLMTKAADMVTRGEMRYFDASRRDEALAWLKN